MAMLSRLDKRRTAEHVLRYRVHAPGSGVPDAVYTARETAEEQCTSFRRRGIPAEVTPESVPLPVNPWLAIDVDLHD